tara:strand:+ start:408 stop:1283 length:876 start_codon:yes stop_codon:yes gene_type:complete
MSNPKIKVKRSSVEGKVPAVTQLERGELAVNSYDGKVYILKDQFSVGIATTTHTINPWNEPSGVGAGISYSGNVRVDELNVIGFSTSNGHHSISSTYKGTQDTVTDAGLILDSNSNIYIDFNGYVRKIIGHSSSDRRIEIGQHNTALVDDIHLKPGTNGQVILHHGSTSSNIKLSTLTTGVNVNGTTVTDGLTVGDYDMPTSVGAQDTVLKSDGTNVVFGSAASATFTEKAFTATQGQTVFTDTTNLPTYVQVFVNGIKIRPTSDFSKSGASITLVSAATAGDEIDLVRFD